MNYWKLLIPILIAALPHSAAGEDSISSKRASAETGAPNAQLEYAKALPLSSREEARRWAQKAADQGFAEAWFWLGYTAHGDSLGFYEKAAELSYPPAFGYVLEQTLLRAGSNPDIAKAKRFGDLARGRAISLGSDTEKVLETIDRCFEAGRPTVPKSDQPTADERTSLSSEECEPFAAAKDYAQYRKCLLAESEPDYHALGEIYANGWGVKRNPMLAISFFCHSSEVPAELEGLVGDLYEGRDLESLPEAFTFCAHVTSGMNAGRCAAEEEESSEELRQERIERLSSGWDARKRAAFAKLRESADAYFEERSGSEVDQSGTARAALVMEEQGALRDRFLELLELTEKGEALTVKDFAAADRELNAAYTSVMKSSDEEWGTVTKGAIKATQKAWLRYRDAWSAFCAARGSNVTPTAIKAQVTRDRIENLKEFLPIQ